MAELNRLGAMQPEADRVLQELVDDAREVLGTGFCMVNLVTADTQFFKVWSGEMPPEIAAVRQAPRERTMCRHVVEGEQQSVVEDFLTTERFREQHLGMGPGIRFYAGTPLKTSEGHAIGSLCLMDSQPRKFDNKDEATLRAFARAVVGRLEALGAAAHERDAKESERQYRRNVFELANDAILIYSTETGLILEANRRACEMYGFPQETLVGKKVSELSLEREAEEEHTREVLLRGAHRGFETVHCRADGARMQVSINSSVTEYGGQRAILSINRDVTDRRRAEEEIRRSQARNNAILDASPDLMFLFNRDGELLDFEAAAKEAQLYVPTEGIIGRKLADMLPAEIAETAVRYIARALDTDEPQVYEYRLPAQDGPRDFEARLVKSGTDEVLSIVRDVTERRRTEEALSLSERSLVQAQRIAHIGNWEHQLKNGRTHWSDEMYRIFGFEPQSLNPMYKTFMLFVHPEDRERVRGSIRGVLRGNSPGEVEYRIVRPDGEVRFVHTQYEVVYDGAGRPIKFFGTVQDVTERKEAVHKLKEAEHKYRFLVEQIPAVAYIDRADVPDAASYTSPRLEALLGYTPEEWLGDRLWIERLHPNDREWVLEADTRSRAAEEPFGEEYRLIAKDGRVVWVRDESALLRDEAGRPLLWQGILLDITERKQAEEALRRSEERFRSLIQNAPDVIMVLDAESNILYDSPSIERVLGYEPGERIGSKGFDYVHPEDIERAEQTFVELLSNPGIGTLTEYRLRHKDGSWRHFEATRTNLLDDPAVGGIVINCRDITERKSVEEALRQSEARFRTIFEKSAMGISIADPNRRFLKTNPAYQDMLGYSGEELSGKPIAEISHPEDVSEDDEFNAALLVGDLDSYRKEKRYVKKNGDLIWVCPTVSAVRNAEGEPQFLIGMVEDITERKRWEERLQESEERYRTLVEQTPAITYIEALDEEELDHKTVYISQQVEGLLGYSPEEWTSDPGLFASLLHPEDRGRVLAEDALTEKTGEPFRMEYRFIARDSRTVWVRDDAVQVKSAEGCPLYWQGVMYDITDLKETEAALRESEERYRRLVELSPEPIAVHSEGRLVYANAATAKLFGASSPEELVGRPILDFIHPDYRDVVNSRVQRAQETGELAPLLEEKYVRLDGSLIDVEVAGMPISYLGKPAVQAMIRDITERKRAEEALRESEERYRRQARELRLLHQVRTALARDLEPPAVFRAVVQTIARTYGYTQVSAYRLQGDTLVLEHQVGYEREIARVPITSGITGRAVRTRRPILVGDVRSDPEFLGAIEGITSKVCVPLLDEGEVVGTLNVESTGGVELTEADLRLMTALSEHVNVALGRARLLARVRESEERFRALIQNASDVLTLLEVDGTVLYESPSVERMLGYSPEEMFGKNAFDYIHPDDLEEVLGAFSRMLADPGFSPSVEYRFRHKDGSWCYLESIGSNLLDDPRVEELVINSRDITERKRWETKLREAEERYRSLIETIPAITYVAELDRNSTPIYLSPQYEAILGFTAEDRLSTPDLWVRRLHPEDRERVLAANDLGNATGEPFDEEYRIVARDGHVVWLHDASVVLRDAEGHPAYRQGVMYDITERRQTEEALHASELRMRTVIEQSPLGIHIFAPDGTSLLTNEAWDELWYLDAEEAAREGNVFKDDQLREAGLIRYIERSAEEGVPIVAPLLLFDPAKTGREGRPRWLRTLIYPVKGEDGRVLETVLLLEDFTERKRAEDALEESEERNRAVVEQSAEAIWMFDPETKRVLEANAAFQ